MAFTYYVVGVHCIFKIKNRFFYCTEVKEMQKTENINNLITIFKNVPKSILILKEFYNYLVIL